MKLFDRGAPNETLWRLLRGPEDAWDLWFRSAGISRAEPPRGPVLGDHDHLIGAAIAGHKRTDNLPNPFLADIAQPQAFMARKRWTTLGVGFGALSSHGFRIKPRASRYGESRSPRFP